MDMEIRCSICFHQKPESNFSELICTHKFCNSCLLTHFKTHVLSNSPNIPCPMEKCGSHVNHSFLKSFLPQNLFQKYDDLLFNQSIYEEGAKKKEKFVMCPNCHISFFIWEDSSYFTCVACKTQFCPLCQEVWEKHKGLTCEVYRSKLPKEEKPLAQDQFESLIKQKNWVKCPKCAAPIEKSKGCNYLRCESSVCQKKTIFCFLCSKLLQSDKLNDHFSNLNVFGKCKGNEEVKELRVKEKEQVKEEDAKFDDLKLNCPGCGNSITNDGVFENDFKCEKCQSLFCRGCDHLFEHDEKSDEKTLASHFSYCIPIWKFFQNQVSEKFSLNCENCNEGKMKPTKFFLYCDKCILIKCMKCRGELKEPHHFPKHQTKCFKNWSEKEYWNEKKQMENFWFCSTCSTKLEKTNKNSYNQNYFQCRKCDNNIYCKKCSKRIDESDLDIHHNKCK